MIRSSVLGLLVAVATAGFGMLSAPAWAAEPADEPARAAKRAEARLWWNDPAVVEKLGLSGDQRAQMDQLFETYRSERRNAAKSSNAHDSFLEALGQGDAEWARRELESWVEGERALLQAVGKLKIEVLALLSEEQRKALPSAYPRLIQQVWMPRSSWEIPPPQKRPGAKRQRKRPAN